MKGSVVDLLADLLETQMKLSKHSKELVDVVRRNNDFLKELFNNNLKELGRKTS